MTTQPDEKLALRPDDIDSLPLTLEKKVHYRRGLADLWCKHDNRPDNSALQIGMMSKINAASVFIQQQADRQASVWLQDIGHPEHQMAQQEDSSHKKGGFSEPPFMATKLGSPSYRPDPDLQPGMIKLQQRIVHEQRQELVARQMAATTLGIHPDHASKPPDIMMDKLAKLSNQILEDIQSVPLAPHLQLQQWQLWQLWQHNHTRIRDILRENIIDHDRTESSWIAALARESYRTQDELTKMYIQWIRQAEAEPCPFHRIDSELLEDREAHCSMTNLCDKRRKLQDDRMQKCLLERQHNLRLGSDSAGTCDTNRHARQEKFEPEIAQLGSEILALQLADGTTSAHASILRPEHHACVKRSASASDIATVLAASEAARTIVPPMVSSHDRQRRTTGARVRDKLPRKLSPCRCPICLESTVPPKATSQASINHTKDAPQICPSRLTQPQEQHMRRVFASVQNRYSLARCQRDLSPLPRCDMNCTKENSKDAGPAKELKLRDDNGKATNFKPDATAPGRTADDLDVEKAAILQRCGSQVLAIPSSYGRVPLCWSNAAWIVLVILFLSAVVLTLVQAV